MARTKMYHSHPFYRSPALPTQARPKPIQNAQVEPIDDFLYCVARVEPGTAMLASYDYLYDVLWIGASADIDPASQFRRDEDGRNDGCQQASVALHKISIAPTNQTHPHVPRWLRRDEWTGYGIIERPTGSRMLERFLQEQQSVMYPEPGQRLAPAFIPLLYQWALNALAAMEFCHYHKIIVADFGIWASWIAPPQENLSLTLFGLHHAHFNDELGGACPGDIRLGPRFSAAQLKPREQHWHWLRPHPAFTEKTDLFDWATFVYGIATDRCPLTDVPGWEEEATPEFLRMDATGSWPALEAEYLGDFVRKCWVRRHYEDAASVKRDLVAFLETKGWRVDEEDNLVGFDAMTLPLVPTVDPPESPPDTPRSPTDSELAGMFGDVAVED